MKKLNAKAVKILLAIVFVCIFLLMLYCNVKTPMLIDDYNYLYSFDDWSRIESIFQIFPSMAAHRLSMNGRVVAHFFLQLFLMFPTMVFKFFNSAVFVTMLMIIHRLAFYKKDCPAWLHATSVCAVFAAIWVYQPVFGEVFLWKSGAANYLWAATLSLIYMYIYMNYSTGQEPNGLISKTAFLLLSLGIGAYSETCAVAAVATAVLFSAQAFFVKKRKPSKLMIASFALVLVGLYFLVSAPAEGLKLTSSFGAEQLLTNIQAMLYYCKSFWPLIAVTDVLFVVAVSLNADKDTLFTAATILLIAVAIMASLTVALYVPERVLTTPFILLVAVCAMLVVELFNKKALLSIALQTIPIFMSIYFIAYGVIDVIQTDSQIKTCEQVILSYANSEETLYVQRFHSKTKYSPFYELNYATDEPSTRHNASMCRYYGVSRIIGVD